MFFDILALVSINLVPNRHPYVSAREVFREKGLQLSCENYFLDLV